MDFEFVSKITDVEVIAVENSIRDLARLHKQYGHGRWRKLKGFAKVLLKDGTIHTAEIHWYKSHALAKKSSKSNCHYWIRDKYGTTSKSKLCTLFE